MYFAIKSTPKVSVSNFWGAVQNRPCVYVDFCVGYCRGKLRFALLRILHLGE
ncbi:hypothetical protein [Moraxella lacunata]|uniref:hypothetical protein n=1 Tax=Moraxella lacunata TaxID=477 RepID=UPI003EE184DE